MKRALLVLLLLTRAANADDAQDACMSQADRGQSLRDEGKLIEARDLFLSCARDPCASVIAKQCATWLQGIDAQMPTVAFRAKGGDGKDIVTVRVLVDGQARIESLDGHPVAINPGVHTFVYQHDRDPDVRDTVVVRAGEKNRPIDIQFATAAKVEAPPPRPEPKPRSFRFPLGAGIALGVGAAGFVTMGVLAGVASDDANHLRGTCAPQCDPSKVDDVHTKVIAANIALGAGIAALGIAALWLILANASKSRF